MFATPTTLIALLTAAWFLVYWIFGGVVFMVIALVRPGRMKRVRFSCLYTLVSVFTAYGAARLGVYWAGQATGSLPEVASLSDAALAVSGLEFVGILMGLGVGFLVTFLAGWIIMLLSRSREPSWYERHQDGLEER